MLLNSNTLTPVKSRAVGRCALLCALAIPAAGARAQSSRSAYAGVGVVDSAISGYVSGLNSNGSDTGEPVSATAAPPRHVLPSAFGSSVSPESAALGDSQSFAYAWGSNTYGQLGNSTNTGTYGANPTPAQVAGLSGVTAVSGGVYHSLALTSGGQVYAWGFNAQGELGSTTNNGNANPNPTPTLVAGLSNVTAIAGGSFHSLALENGTVYAWGNNVYGQLGTASNSGNQSPNPVPTAVVGLSNVTAIAAGQGHSLAVTNGTVYAWGLNQFGQLGNSINNGNQNANPLPTQVVGLSGVTAVAAGYAHNLAIAGGNLYAWGSNNSGQLGVATSSGDPAAANPAPAQVTSLSNVTAIAAGYQHSLAVTNGNVYAWGANFDGQLGNGSTSQHDNYTPTEISYQGVALSSILQVAAGNNSSYALARDGSLYVWGDNSVGELGIGNTTNQLTPYHLLPPAGEYYDAISCDNQGGFALAILGEAPPGSVPEPSTWVGGLLGVGLLGLSLRPRRKTHLV